MGLSLDRRHFIALGLAGTAMGAWATSSTATTPAKNQKILVLGDSLSAEYGLKRGTGWVALLEIRLKAEKLDAVVVNASISGETTSGGRSRLGVLLSQHRPSHVVIELGGNDALRGLPLSLTEDNLSQMTQTAQKAGASVLLAGMQVPPNYGVDYSKRFAAMFQGLAREKSVKLVPFLLAGLDDTERYFQPDRIHPNVDAQALMLDKVWTGLKSVHK